MKTRNSFTISKEILSGVNNVNTRKLLEIDKSTRDELCKQKHI